MKKERVCHCNRLGAGHDDPFFGILKLIGLFRVPPEMEQLAGHITPWYPRSLPLSTCCCRAASMHACGLVHIAGKSRHTLECCYWTDWKRT